jgi:hypothetical protein
MYAITFRSPQAHDLIPLGQVMLDWEPATGGYRVWNIDFTNRLDLLPGQVLMSSVWPSIAEHRLLNVGADRMLDWEPSTGRYRVWQIDRANRVDLLPGEPVLAGTWGSIRNGQQLIYLDQDQMLDWEASTGRYRVWNVDRTNPVDLLPGAPRLDGVWASIRNGHRLIYLGQDHMLDWQPSNGHYRVWRLDRTNAVDLLPGEPELESTWASIRG